MRFLIITLLFTTGLSAYANDCKNDVEEAVWSCHLGITNAKGSQVGGFSGTTGNANAGTSITGAADAISAKIAGAIGKCQGQDADTCVEKCNKALKAASSQNNQALVGKIKENMNSCFKRIEGLTASAQQSRAGLAQAANEGIDSHNSACYGDCQVDRRPSFDPNAGASVEKAGVLNNNYYSADPNFKGVPTLGPGAYVGTPNGLVRLNPNGSFGSETIPRPSKGIIQLAPQ